MGPEEIKKLEKEYIMNTYSRQDLVVDYGKGCKVFDKEGKEYLDFLGGIACCSVGHGNEKVKEAICEEAGKILNISNLYYTEPQVILAKKLSNLSGLAKCFFCNSGTEANEAAIKLAKKVTGKKKFIAFEGSFHGRTTASLSATWKVKYKDPFTPLVPNVVFAKYNNIDSLKVLISDEIAGVIIEPIQGEAGIIVPDKGYLKEVEKICQLHGILLIIDEIQSGNGKTGKFFAYEHENVKPDIVTMAKGLANGVPIGVCIAKKGIDFSPGDHASTFGGNNLACAAANATIDYILENKLMQNASIVGEYFMEKLEELKKSCKIIKKVKGKGLMIGLELNENQAKEIVQKSLKKGLIINNATENVLRFLPPLSIGKSDVDKAIGVLSEVLG
jgi:acetylornithine/N-succinyldiaminopimelate aminotransferase